MNRFNRSRSTRKQVETYEVGALVEYRFFQSEEEPLDLLAIVLEYNKEGYYIIKFLDDGSDLDVVHSEIRRAAA
tara:strand:+ start:2791 stop:3012 length:222 start_codon:yes stop_codon:yes gene_type:complete